MDRNTLTGLVLIFVIIGASVFLMKPSEEELKREQQLQDSLALVRAGKKPADPDTAAATTDVVLDSTLLSGPFGNALVGEEQVITLENEFIKAHISTKGGRVTAVEVKGEQTYDGEPLMLLGGEHTKFGLFFSSAGKNIITNDLYFTPDGGNVSVAGQDSASVTFRLTY